VSYSLMAMPENCVYAEFVSPAFPTTYPTVIHKERISAAALSAMEDSWNTRLFAERKIRLLQLTDVFVAGEGIVFDRVGRVYGDILTQQAPEHIERAAAQVAAAIESGDHETRTEPTVLCVKPGWQNYGHWLVEILPIADAAKRALGEDDLRFLIPNTFAPVMKKVVDDSLSIVGVAANRVSSYSFLPVFAKRLFVMHGMTHHGVYMSPLVFDTLNRLQDHTIGSDKMNIYIKREQYLSRSIENEAEIDEFMHSRGFFAFYPERFSLKEQISFFSGAKNIVGVAGAAMTNICFARAEARVLLLYPERMTDTFFWFMANHRKLDFVDVRCAQSGPSRSHLPWDSSLRVEIQDLQELLTSRSCDKNNKSAAYRTRMKKHRRGNAMPAVTKVTRTLDLGCGPQINNKFDANELYGIDVRASDNNNIKSADLSIESIPFPDNYFDFVTAFDFLEHVPRVIYAPHRRNCFVELMNEVYRVLKPGGLFFSSTPAYPRPEAFQDPTHVNIITENTFTRYFDVDFRWASMYGFKGAFRVHTQMWNDFHLETALIKVDTP